MAKTKTLEERYTAESGEGPMVETVSESYVAWLEDKLTEAERGLGNPGKVLTSGDL